MFKIVIMFKSFVNVGTPRHKNICIFAIKYIMDYHTIGLFAIFLRYFESWCLAPRDKRLK